MDAETAPLAAETALLVPRVCSSGNRQNDRFGHYNCVLGSHFHRFAYHNYRFGRRFDRFGANEETA